MGKQSIREGPGRENPVCQSDDKPAAAGASAASAADAIQHLAVQRRGSRSRRSCATSSAAERIQLLDWARSRTLPHRLVIRSRIILLAGDGLGTSAIAKRLHVSAATVRLWCRRFNMAGTGALMRDRPGRGRQPGRSPARILIILRTMRDRSGSREPAWTTRALAAAAGTSAATVWRVWRHFAIGPASSIAEIDRAIAQAINETARQTK